MAKNMYLVNGDNGKVYHAGIIADNIIKKFPGIRDAAEYRTLEGRFFDYTSACDRDEQRGWMGHYMNQALEMEAQSRRLRARGREHWSAAAGQRWDAAIQFIVAYDLIAE